MNEQLCKHYALYGTMCGSDDRIKDLCPGYPKPITIRVEDHRACMGENPELCSYYS